MLIKRVVFVCLSMVIAYFFIDLTLDIIRTYNYDFKVGESLVVAFLANIYGIGIFAFVGFVLPTSKLLPASYFTIKNADQLKSVYRILGVSYFRYLLLLFFWGSKKNRKKYFNGTRSGLTNFIYQSHQSEFGHLGGFVLLMLVFGIMVVKQFWLMAFFTLIINGFGNFYPIVLQRYHRIRIERIS